MVPPGWKFGGGAVVGEDVTLPMPTLIWVTPLLGAAVTDDFFFAVVVVFFAVVAVAPPAVVVLPPTVVSVLPGATVVVVDSSAPADVVLDVDFLLPPPQAAATSPAATTAANAFQPLALAELLPCVALMGAPFCPGEWVYRSMAGKSCGRGAAHGGAG